jgi:hypothetical protein
MSVEVRRRSAGDRAGLHRDKRDDIGSARETARLRRWTFSLPLLARAWLRR